MNKEKHFYICKNCEREDEEGPCLLLVDTSPGIPTECVFGLGFESDWKEINKEEFEKEILE